MGPIKIPQLGPIEAVGPIKILGPIQMPPLPRPPVPSHIILTSQCPVACVILSAMRAPLAAPRSQVRVPGEIPGGRCACAVSPDVARPTVGIGFLIHINSPALPGLPMLIPTNRVSESTGGEKSTNMMTLITMFRKYAKYQKSEKSDFKWLFIVFVFASVCVGFRRASGKHNFPEKRKSAHVLKLVFPDMFVLMLFSVFPDSNKN